MDQVLDYIRKNRMVNTGEKIVVGVSGGPDSVCLLFLLKKYMEILGITLAVVHLEHGIRGKESIEDAAFVEKLCEDWELPFFLYQKDVPAWAANWKCSEEEAGRRARYDAFEEVRKKLGAHKIAVAHNQDDQAETILFHLARGSGLTGLCGMRPVQGRIIRPLLCLSRQEIEGILAEERLAARLDSTNRETDYARNRIRLHILPLLREELNAKAVVHMAQAGERLASIEDYMTRQAAGEAKRLAEERDGRLYLNRKALLDQHEAMKEYILRCCLGRIGAVTNIGAVHIDDLKRLSLNQSGRTLQLPGGFLARTEGDSLILGRETFSGQGQETNGGLPSAAGKEGMALPVGSAVRYGKYRIAATLEPYKNELIPEKMYTKWFDYDKIKNTVRLRPRASGDYLTVTAGGGRKTLKKYLIDEKVPAGERAGLCLLADGSHILWVVGRRISEAYKVTKETQRVLKVQVMEE